VSRHVHFMGIGGVSMAGLARHALAAGDRVSGCDASDSPTLETLRELGMHVHVGHDPGHLEGVDVLVTSAAVADDAPERLAALERGIPILRRIDLLRDLFDRHRALGVTGTHGKSTTSGMLASILIETGRDPHVQLGAHLPTIGGVMRYGSDPFLVAEVDESDRGFADLHADVAIVTNLEDDHIAGEHDERRTYHASLEDLERATRRYAHQAATLVSCADWPGLDDLLAGHPHHLRYGESSDATHRIDDLTLDGTGSHFRVTHEGETVDVTLYVPGRYNALNATAALTAAYAIGVPLAVAAAALATYRGVGRRWDRWGERSGAPIIDDYAHHPTEVAATLAAARATGRRVRAVLQPHRWVRTARHWPALADAAGAADETLVVDVYGAGERPIPGVSSDQIVERMRQAGHDASRHDLASAARYLRATVDPGDLIVTLGAGDVWRVAAALVDDPQANLTLGEAESE